MIWGSNDLENIGSCWDISISITVYNTNNNTDVQFQ